MNRYTALVEQEILLSSLKAKFKTERKHLTWSLESGPSTQGLDVTVKGTEGRSVTQGYSKLPEQW